MSNGSKRVQDQKQDESQLRESKLAEKQKEVEARESEAKSELERLRSENEQLRNDNQKLRTESTENDRGPSLNPNTRLTVGNGYDFRVESRDKKLGIEPTVVKGCCDESEALRYFCCITPDPKRPGRQLNPEKASLFATCLNPERRRESLLKKKRISSLRGRLENGHNLSENEMNELQVWEESRATPA